MADTAPSSVTLFLPENGVVDPQHVGALVRDLAGEGVPDSTHLVVGPTAPASLAVTVSAGACYVRQDADALGPIYRVAFDEPVELDLDAPDASFARIDLVVVEVLDPTYAGASTQGRLRVVTGTPAGVPAVPATPSSSVALARVTVAASAASVAGAAITNVVALAAGTLAGEAATAAALATAQNARDRYVTIGRVAMMATVPMTANGVNQSFGSSTVISLDDDLLGAGEKLQIRFRAAMRIQDLGSNTGISVTLTGAYSVDVTGTPVIATVALAITTATQEVDSGWIDLPAPADWAVLSLLYRFDFSGGVSQPVIPFWLGDAEIRRVAA